MWVIFFIVRKEFRQIFRHRVLLPMIFVLPIVQLLILSNAADYEVRNIYLHIADADRSATSHRLAGKFAASDHFELTGHSYTGKTGNADLESGRADMVLEIPAGFERSLYREGTGTLLLSVNAINATQAGIGSGYAQAILRDFNTQLTTRLEGQQDKSRQFDVRPVFWYNPTLEYKAFMVPGILVMLVTLVGMFLSGLNIVKEKEVGTIEQINVTPIRKRYFIVGKLLPFWIIALAELSIGLAFGKLVFQIPMEGSLVVIFGFAGLYLVAVLGIGLLVSTISTTQQQAMFIAYFIMVIFILMSGLFTPIESMPGWAQVMTRFNPIAYFVEVMRMVMLKGSGWYEIRWHCAAVAGLAVAVNGLAVLNYRKRGA
ncbi:MAG: ABC transporter permease [Saprospiraceae bacterium]|jgi:ABC-2 type transport system permease protein